MPAKPKILIVDDKRENLVALEIVLKSLNVEFVRALSGNEALGLTLKHEFAIGIIDVQMPDMDGFEATKAIRQREAESVKDESFDEIRESLRVPIIAMTANAMQGDKDKCLEAGMDDYLAKPVKSHLLEAMLVKWLPTEVSESLGKT